MRGCHCPRPSPWGHCPDLGSGISDRTAQWVCSVGTALGWPRGTGLGEQSGIPSPLCPSLGQPCLCPQAPRELGSLSLTPCMRRLVTARHGRSRRGSAAQVGEGPSWGSHLQGSFPWPPPRADPLQPPGPWSLQHWGCGGCGESSQVPGPGEKLPPHQLCPSQPGTAPLCLPLHPMGHLRAEGRCCPRAALGAPLRWGLSQGSRLSSECSSPLSPGSGAPLSPAALSASWVSGAQPIKAAVPLSRLLFRGVPYQAAALPWGQQGGRWSGASTR